MMVAVLVLLFAILLLLAYIYFSFDSSINILLQFAKQFSIHYKDLNQKNLKNHQGIYFKIEKLEQKISALESQINLLEYKLLKSIESVLRREELLDENQKLKKIIKRQNKTQPPR